MCIFIQDFFFSSRHRCQALSSYFTCAAHDQESRCYSHQHCNHINQFRHRNAVSFIMTAHRPQVRFGALGLQFNTSHDVIQRLNQVQGCCSYGKSDASQHAQPCSRLSQNQACFPVIKRSLFYGNVSNIEPLQTYPWICQTRTIFTSSLSHDPISSKSSKKIKMLGEQENKSKVEEAVEAMKEKKEKLKEKAFQMECSPEEIEPVVAVSPPPKKTIWQRVKHEVVHYYNGFKLLFLETKIAARMLWRVMNGKVLSRRERRQVSHLE